MRAVSLESTTKIRPCVPIFFTCNQRLPSTRGRCCSAPRTGIVVSPQRPNLVLSTDIPDVELDVLVGYTLDVETDGGNGGNFLVELQLVENG